MTGGRAPSFHDLSVGEALAPSEAEGNSGGGKFPSQTSHRKEQPGRLGTEEKIPRPSNECPHVNTFERYQSVTGVIKLGAGMWNSEERHAFQRGHEATIYELTQEEKRLNLKDALSLYPEVEKVSGPMGKRFMNVLEKFRDK